MKPVLVLNAGSSSLKFAVFGEGPRALARGQVAGIGGNAEFSVEAGGVKTRGKLVPGLSPAIAEREVFNWLAANGFGAETLSGVGHRLVHGGTQFTQATVVDDAVMAALQPLRKLAPLHMPFGLDALATARAAMPGLLHLACFDTSFHATNPDVMTRLPLPDGIAAKGYRRYGFYGLNCEHVAESFARATGMPLPRRLIIAHLGSGSGLCALRDGVSFGNTMGYSTLDGLIMGTRPGSLDPGVLIGLMRDGLSLDALEDMLYHEAGLKGLSGISNDMRVLLQSTDPRAAMAVEHYCLSAARHAASLAVAMGGLDGVVFTGGVGENAKAVRDRILQHLAVFPGVPHWVIPADEEVTMARHVMGVTRA